jgi:hypothetical protein
MPGTPPRWPPTHYDIIYTDQQPTPGGATSSFHAGATANCRSDRSSFATLLIHEGRTIVDVARQLGHSANTCLKDYAGVFEEFDPAQRVTADEAIASARSAKPHLVRGAQS